MNNKKMLVLAAILGVAIVILVLVKVLGNREPSETSLQFIPALTEKTIGAIVLKDATDWVKLQRKGDKWIMIPKVVLEKATSGNKTTGIAKVMETETVKPMTPAGASASEYPADSSTVASLLENVLKLKKDILVSENPSKQTTFEVDSAKGITVDLFDLEGKALGRVFIGKNAADYSSTYVRADNSSAVYQVQNLSRYAFGTDHKRWTDKSIWKFDKAAVAKISIAKKGSPAIELAFEGDSAKKVWNLKQPVQKPADSAKVDELLNTFSNLTAAEYEDSSYTDSATGLADPSITVSIALKSGATHLLKIGNAKTGASKFWVAVPEKPYVLLVSEFDQKKVDKKPEDFQKQELKPIEAVPAKAPAKKGKK
jgi:hypothetical protein